MIVPHPIEDSHPSKILVSLISTFCLQIISFEDIEFKKLGQRGAAPPGTNSKPQIPTVFPITKFNATQFPIALRQIDYPNRNKCPIKL